MYISFDILEMHYVYLDIVITFPRNLLIWYDIVLENNIKWVTADDYHADLFHSLTMGQLFYCQIFFRIEFEMDEI